MSYPHHCHLGILPEGGGGGREGYIGDMGGVHRLFQLYWGVHSTVVSLKICNSNFENKLSFRLNIRHKNIKHLVIQFRQSKSVMNVCFLEIYYKCVANFGCPVIFVDVVTSYDTLNILTCKNNL